MFTLKLYASDGAIIRIYEAESFTVLRCNQGQSNGPCHEWSEITSHLKAGEGLRADIGDSPYQPDGGVWQKAIIENASGRTTQIIGNFGPSPRPINAL